MRARLCPLLTLFLTPALFAVSLYLYSHNNHFPYTYHTDEHTKAEQIMADQRNFRHPPLLLEVSDLAVKLLKTPRQYQPVTEVGRLVSAILAALGVTALALAAARSYGLAGFLIAGAAVALCPPLLVYAHYMKEDASLAAGLAITALASRLLWDSRSLVTEIPWTIFLAIACALAISGKYVGVASLLIAAPVLCLKPVRSWAMLFLRPVLFTAALIGALALINHRAVANMDAFRRGFFSEEQHYRTSHFGLTMSRPNTWFLHAYTHEAQTHIQVLAYLAVLLLFITWRRRSWWDVTIVFFPIAFLAMLCWNILPWYRYLLPVIVFAHFLAALALLWLIDLLPSKTSNQRLATGKCILCTIAVAVLVFFQLPRTLNFLHQFSDDSRTHLRQYIAANVPAGSLVASDDFCCLVGPSDTSSGRPPLTLSDKRIFVQAPMFAADLGSFDDLRRSGYRYAAVCDLTYFRFFEPQVFPVEGAEDLIQRRRDWYAQLFKEGTLVWSSEPHPPTHSYTNPAVRLYRLPGVPAATAN